MPARRRRPRAAAFPVDAGRPVPAPPAPAGPVGRQCPAKRLRHQHGQARGENHPKTQIGPARRPLPASGRGFRFHNQPCRPGGRAAQPPPFAASSPPPQGQVVFRAWRRHRAEAVNFRPAPTAHRYFSMQPQTRLVCLSGCQPAKPLCLPGPHQGGGGGGDTGEAASPDSGPVRSAATSAVPGTTPASPLAACTGSRPHSRRQLQPGSRQALEQGLPSSTPAQPTGLSLCSSIYVQWGRALRRPARAARIQLALRALPRGLRSSVFSVQPSPHRHLRRRSRTHEPHASS